MLTNSPSLSASASHGLPTVLRLRNIGGIEQELVEMTARHDRLAGDLAAMTALLDSLPAPVWGRDAQGRLNFVNAAYARAAARRATRPPESLH